MAELKTRPAEAPAADAGLVQAMAVAAAFSAGSDVQWAVDDDRCDCTFQRVGWWTNPYLAVTQEVRLCCAWAFLFERFPEMQRFMQVSEVFRDPNTGRVDSAPARWDSPDGPMPRALWYRQLAREQGRPLAEIRTRYQDQAPPAARR